MARNARLLSKVVIFRVDLALKFSMILIISTRQRDVRQYS